ncbi:hypothetical protein PIB30_067776 [Stylosanthes scabra]|uniref:RNase H type-1 domain-containing protein n=1 Tax=Stylosanthes scabra TaxID=79078 RepID=A0ABU6QNM9_9FABA|nr:hypothetical protein [Stylosanthes scabra]
MQGLFCSSLLSLWNARNKLIFEGTEFSALELVELANSKHEEYLKAVLITDSGTKILPPGAASSDHWMPPQIIKLRVVEFSHVKRSGNRIAHELAQLALTNPNFMWLEDAPIDICNLALMDRIDPIHE